MGEVVNLNKYRKKKAREEREKRAEQNRLKRGLSRAELALREKKKQIEDKRLDGHKLDSGLKLESGHKLERDDT